VTDQPRDTLNILAPESAKPKLQYLHRQLYRDAAERSGLSRRELLGLGALGLIAAACGGSTNAGGGGGGGGSAPASGGGNSLAGKPMESNLVIYNWSEYDAASTTKKFEANHPSTNVKETFYSSNDELLAKLAAGGTGYDIIVPSQNAVAQLISQNGLMSLDKALLPNLKNLDPKFLKAEYDPTGNFHVIKDYGITMIYYMNTVVTDHPKTMLDFYNLLSKYVSKGRTNILDGAEEVIPLALMALGLDPNTDKSSDFAKVKKFLLSIRKGVTTIDSSNYINDAIAGKIILGQGWNGDVRRIYQARKKQGDITPVLLSGMSEVWSDNWCIPVSAPDPVAAHAWINWLLEPTTAVAEMNYHNYPIPIPSALSQMPASLKNDPLFNVPSKYTDNYKYILNVSPEVVNQRTQIYGEFKAA
jgi:spermidine/putrescine transport system substrate-binding protein